MRSKPYQLRERMPQLLLWLGWLGILIVSSRTSAESASAKPTVPVQRPHFLFLITDDQRFDMLGTMTPVLQTPQMDQLVREGVHFQNAFVTTAICAASRASILTGLVERTHQFTFGTPPLADQLALQSYPALLRQAGYRTGYVGKLGVKIQATSRERMFDSLVELHHPYWKKQADGSQQHLTDIEGERAIAFLRQHAEQFPNQPFCLTVGFNAPHAEDANPQQYIWQTAVDELYQDVVVPKPLTATPEFYNHLHPFLRDGTMNRHRWYWRFDSERKRQQMTKGYWRMISGVDLVIGRLRQELQTLQLAENTVILLIGDNGYFLGERGYAGKWLPYEPSIRVPLIVYDPSGRFCQRGLQVTQFALNIDLAATILEMAGVPVPATQGRSLTPLLRGETPTDWRQDFFIEHLMEEPSIRKHEGVRTTEFKYSRYFEADPIWEELYDLRQDPLETVNLINSPTHQSIVKKLRQRTQQYRQQYEKDRLTSLPAVESEDQP